MGAADEVAAELLEAVSVTVELSAVELLLLLSAVLDSVEVVAAAVELLLLLLGSVEVIVDDSSPAVELDEAVAVGLTVSPTPPVAPVEAVDGAAELLLVSAAVVAGAAVVGAAELLLDSAAVVAGAAVVGDAPVLGPAVGGSPPGGWYG